MNRLAQRLRLTGAMGPWALLACLLTLAGCEDVGGQAPLASAPFSGFNGPGNAYEVLLRDCGFPECHGSSERFFRVYGPGRTRLRSGMRLISALEQPDIDEVYQTYDSALAMVDPDDPAASPLLRKPLSVAAGGAGHQGTDRYGRDVYRSRQDEGYRILAAFVVPEPEPVAAQPATVQPAP